MPCSSTPARSRCPASSAPRCSLPPCQQRRLSQPRVLRGSIPRPARSLCTLRSRDRSRTTQHSVPAGGQPLPGGTGYPQSSHEGFSHHEPFMASSSSRFSWRTDKYASGRSATTTRRRPRPVESPPARARRAVAAAARPPRPGVSRAPRRGAGAPAHAVRDAEPAHAAALGDRQRRHGGVPLESARARRRRCDRCRRRVRRAHVRGGAAYRGAGRARGDGAGHGAARRGDGGRDRACAATRGGIRACRDVDGRAPAGGRDRGGGAKGRGIPGARLRHLARRPARETRRLGRRCRLQGHTEASLLPARSVSRVLFGARRPARARAAHARRRSCGARCSTRTASRWAAASASSPAASGASG